MPRSSALQNINKQTKEKLVLKGKTTHFILLVVHLCWMGQLLPQTLVIAQHGITVSPKNKRNGALKCSRSSPSLCLDSILHQLMDSVLIEHEGRVKLSPSYQILEALENDRRCVLASAAERKSIWSLCVWRVRPHLSSIGHQRRNLTSNWQVCSIFQTEKKRGMKESFSQEERRGRGWEKTAANPQHSCSSTPACD